ncbi:MBL fold metallo-hydrolase [Clostridia bacterium]|nr:MBL fold metallo-hydrolase [Clostridia bacterium]
MTFKTIPVGFLKTNCYVIIDDTTRECVVIDPGAHPNRILTELAGLTPRYIFLTHGHFDHIQAVPEVRAAYPVPLVIHRADEQSLYDRTLSRIPANVKIAPPEVLAEDGQIFTVGGLTLDWIHTPGHTPGSSVIRCRRELFTGDTLFAGDCGRCDLPGGDYGQMLKSLRRLAELDGDYGVHPGHEEASTLDTERRVNVNMREATG